jgi:hypothetical protein
VQAGRLKRSNDKSPEDLGFSPALADEAAALACARQPLVKISELPEKKRLQRLQLGALAALAVVSGTAVFAPGVWATGLSHLTSAPPPGEADGDRLVDVAVSQLDLEVKPPAYAQLKPRQMPRSAGEIEALAGSEVRFEGTILHPAISVALVLESDPEGRWMVELEKDGTIRGSLRVARDDRYQFVLMNTDGDILRERAWRNVRIRADLPPEVTLILPENDMEVKPNDQVGFFFEAGDDFGLDRVELVVTDDDG